MNKTIKSIVKVILMVITCLAFIGMFAEGKDGGICLPWTIGCVTAFFLSATILDKMGAFGEEGEDVEI